MFKFDTESRWIYILSTSLKWSFVAVMRWSTIFFILYLFVQTIMLVKSDIVELIFR